MYSIEIINNRVEVELINEQKYWDRWTIGRTSVYRILDTNRGYESNTTRIASIPEGGPVRTSSASDTGNIPPIDISEYTQIRIWSDDDYKVNVIVYEMPSSTTGFKGISNGWNTDEVTYNVEDGYKYMSVALAKSNPNDGTITASEYTHVHIIGIK